MLLRVLLTLEATPGIGSAVLCIDDAAPLDEIPEVAARLGDGRLQRLPAGGGASASTLAAFDALIEHLPLLVVTADHPLLTPPMVERFCVEAADSGADVAVALTSMRLVERDYPGAVRTRLRFAEGAYSSCNLFALMTPRARRAPECWSRLERSRKRPWRLVARFGIAPLLLYLTGRLSLAGAMARLSRRLRLQAQAVELPFAEAAIDVDTPADLALAETILRDCGDAVIG